MDEAAKKSALRMITYGLYVVTTAHEGELGAATINWLTQASFAPPLVVAALRADANTLAGARASKAFAVNVLGTGQKDMAYAFFKPTNVEGNKLSGYEFEPAPSGSPLLLEAPAWFDCRVHEIIERGDHHIVVGEVTDAGVRKEMAPLTLSELGVYYGG
ncbi:MAG TPA: flavin reductase family protein [Dehalococcoidia bacterium]|nr:flavin reductase family protein [Dehalococcoidia bacterium]